MCALPLCLLAVTTLPGVFLLSQSLIMAMIVSFETGIISGHNGVCLITFVSQSTYKCCSLSMDDMIYCINRYTGHQSVLLAYRVAVVSLNLLEVINA